MKYCPQCEVEYEDDAVFCAKCGGKLAEQVEPEMIYEQVRYCKKCGSENDGDAVFCDKCGFKLAGNIEQIPPEPVGVKTKHCPHCGAKVNANAVVCVKCGCSLQEDSTPNTPEPRASKTKFCPNCGGQVNENATVCVKCGVPISEDTARPTGNIPQSDHVVEQILFEGLTNWYKSLNVIQGKMKITTKRIIFKPLTSTFTGIFAGLISSPTYIPLNEIQYVERTTVLAINIGINVHLKSGIIYKFGSLKRDEIVHIIQDLLDR